jgi:ABC-2 type transport system permease protein
MFSLNDIKTVFSFFFKKGMRAKKTKVFFLISLIPAIILGIIRIAQFVNPGEHIWRAHLFPNIALSFYFTLFIQIIALFYGNSVLSDEIDDKTLIYLTTSPVSKPSILVGKYLSLFMTAAIIISSGLLISFLIGNFDNLFQLAKFQQLGAFVGVGVLSFMAYSAFFTFLGTLFKRSVLFGIFYIFGWESIVQFFRGVTQKLTINHYVKSLLPGIPKKNSFLSFQLEASPAIESILTLLFLTVIFLAISSLLFYRKEYVLSDIT